MHFRRTILGICMLMTLACKQRPDQNSEVRNTLAAETSPYLLQHAENPVHWQAWGDAAWERAKEENKLVIISIGYSSCHWCHVMEEETFENDSVAALMNRDYISIKVDREERPDIDNIYMTAVQLMTGNGGWPLNVIALPNGKPLYGGTYHPREEWLETLDKIEKLYREDPERAEEYASKVAQGIQQVNLIPEASKGELSAALLDTLQPRLENIWDKELGGMQGDQKFMLPAHLDFLWEWSVIREAPAARTQLKTTLAQLVKGGIYDQLGGGFFRYSTDKYWRIPHFEKMLYDNAQLLSVFSKAYQSDPDPEYQRVVEESFAFLQRRMRNADGGYYAAMDADSDGEEGKFYTWGYQELQGILQADFDLFSRYYEVYPESSWEKDKYVLRKTITDARFEANENLPTGKLLQLIPTWKQRLLQARNERTLPGIDDKIITSWNALLIQGLVDAYNTFNEPVYLEAAQSCFEFLEQHAFLNGNLKHSYKPGDAKTEGFLEDYAYLASAALALYETTMDVAYLETAASLVEKVLEDFQDPNSELFTYRKQADLIAAIVKTDDGVLPSPNAVFAELLFKMGHLTFNREYLEKSERMLASVLPYLREYPENYGAWSSLFLKQTHPYYEVAVVGPDAGSLLKELLQEPLPDALIIGSAVKNDEIALFKMRYFPEETQIYVCRNHSCKLPVAEASRAIAQMRP